MSDEIINKAKSTGSDFTQLSEATGRSKEVVNQLLDAIYMLEGQVKNLRGANDFSGEARLMKSKYETARRELNQLTKFKENLLGIISEKIKTIYASANAISTSSEDEKIKKLSADILKEVKDLVEKVAEKRNAA